MANKKRQYPSSVEEVLDDTVKYRRDVICVMNEFKNMNPWKGRPRQKARKLLWLHLHFCRIYGKNTALSFDPEILNNRESKNGNGFYAPALNEICLLGKISVLTFLHEWGHNLHGESEHLACWWSINLFRKIFPDNFNRLQENARGHYLARR